MNERPQAGRRRRRRGAAVVAVLVLVLVAELIIVGMVLGGARDQDLSVRRIETIQAFYAAEAGMNMSIREFIQNVDGDGDGGIGSISDDADDGNNPTFGLGSVYVSMAGSDPVVVTSNGSAGSARREIQANVQ